MGKRQKYKDNKLNQLMQIQNNTEEEWSQEAEDNIVGFFEVLLEEYLEQKEETKQKYDRHNHSDNPERPL
jgi:predicted RNA-binding protein